MLAVEQRGDTACSRARMKHAIVLRADDVGCDLFAAGLSKRRTRIPPILNIAPKNAAMPQN